MNRPKQSVFMGHKYRLEWKKDLRDEKRRKMFGITNHEESLIQFDEGMNLEREKETVLHEIIHQMFAHSGLGYEEEEEEQLASFLGNALLHHMSENRVLWRYLMRAK